MTGLAVFGLLVGAGVLGGLLRHGAALLGAKSRFPTAVLIVNAAGSLVAGAILGAASTLPAGIPLILLTGFCGALTTFSTFSVDTVRLILARRGGAALWNIISSLALGLGCAALGAGVALAII